MTEQLFHHVWHGSADATDPQRLAALQTLLQDHMAQCQRPWLEPGSEVVKQRLRANTDAALAAGVFGVPTLAWATPVLGAGRAAHAARLSGRRCLVRRTGLDRRRAAARRREPAR